MPPSWPKVHFSSFTIESILVIVADMCLLKAAYGWVLCFDAICYSVPFYWWVQFIYIRVIFDVLGFYSYFIFCFLIALCLHNIFCLVFLSVVLVDGILWFFPSVYSFILCVSVLDFFVYLFMCMCMWSTSDLCKRKVHIYSNLSSEYILSYCPLQIQSFTPMPFMFLLSQIIPICAVSSFPNCGCYCLFLLIFSFQCFSLL